MYRTLGSNCSVCHAISRFGRHLGPAWHTLPRSHVFSFSRPGAGIYFVTLGHKWKVGDFLFTTGLFLFFSQFSINFFYHRKIFHSKIIGYVDIPGFLKTRLAKISTHSTNWQFKTTKLIQKPIKNLYMTPGCTLMVPRNIPTSPNLK